MNKELVVNKTVALGSSLTSSGILADIAMFNDKGYLYLALIGAFVSMFGVIHELATHEKNLTKQKIVGEIIKGFTLGTVSVIFWYLFLITAGDALVQRLFQLDLDKSFSNTMWLIVSIMLTWRAIPIYDWIVSLIVRKGKEL